MHFTMISGRQFVEHVSSFFVRVCENIVDDDNLMFHTHGGGVPTLQVDHNELKFEIHRNLI